MKFLKPFRNKDAWLAFFVLGIIMLNYPFLVICNKTTPVFGVPLLILYFFVGWPLSIFVIFIFSRSIVKDEKVNDESEKREHPREDT